MRNIILDMGNVLLNYDPAHFVQREDLPPEDRALLLKHVFRAPEWPMMDAGAMDEPEFERLVYARIPERLHATARRLIYGWEDPVEPIPGMAELVKDCKARGMGVYLLSNASRRQPQYWPTIPGHEYFDGTVVSAFERQVKPGPEIYRILLDRFALDPADCLFVDDMPQNVEGARAVGMDGYLFDGDSGKLREYIFSH